MSATMAFGVPFGNEKHKTFPDIWWEDYLEGRATFLDLLAWWAGQGTPLGEDDVVFEPIGPRIKGNETQPKPIEKLEYRSGPTVRREAEYWERRFDRYSRYGVFV